MPNPTVLFLCTGNSARSQMAEGWLRHLAGDKYEALSAGTHPSKLNPLAVEAMREVGVDISRQHSKSVEHFLDKPIDYVITVCDRAKESCPYLPSLFQTFHWEFDDPAETAGAHDERLKVFRRVRDQIREKLENDFLCLCKIDED